MLDNKLCISCLRDKHTFPQCHQPRKCQAEGCNSSHNTLLHGADGVFPTKQSTNSNIFQPSGNTGQSKATTGQQPSNMTLTMSSITGVKGLLQVTELQLVNSSGVDTKALVLCDTACSSSWVAGSLADKLGLHGKALKLTIKGINTEEVVDTRVDEVTANPREHQVFESFTINPFVKESLNVGSDVIIVQALPETYAYLAVLDPVTYSYEDIEMILGQDVYHAIRPIEYFSADEKRSPVVVRLPIGWVLSGPLPSSYCLTSTCFKVNIEHDNELAGQVKSWYDVESFGANKEVDSRSAADARDHEIFESTTIHNGLRYNVGMLWAADNTKLPNNYFFSLVQLKSLEKRSAKNEDRREKYTSNIKEDLNKGYVIELPDAHKVESRSDKEWYLPHHPVVNQNKPGKCVGCSMEQQSFMVPPWINLCSLHLICSKTLFKYFFSSDNIHMPSLSTSRECFNRLVFYHQVNHHFAFCGGRTPQITLCINIRAIYSGLKTRPPAPTMLYNALRETMPSFIPKLQKPSLKTFTWTITLTQWSLLRKPSIDRRNWYIFSILVGSSLQSS